MSETGIGLSTVSPNGASRRPLLIIFLIVFADLVGFGIVIPILPYYAKSFGASATALGWLMTSYSALQFLFAPLWGQWSDHVGRRPILLLSILGGIVGYLVMAFASVFTASPGMGLLLLFCGRSIAGISGANISTATAYITDHTTEANRAKGMGMIGAAFGLGFIFGPAIGGVLSRYGYGVPMAFAAMLSAINLFFTWAYLPEKRLSAEIRAAHRFKRFDLYAWKETLWNPTTGLGTLLFFLSTLALTQMEVVFALFMATKHGYSAERAGWLLALSGTIMVVIQGGLIGRLSKRWGDTALISTGLFLLVLGLAGMPLPAPQHLGALLAVLALLSIGHGLTHPSLSSFVSKGAPAAKRGATMGIYQSAGSLARVIGPPVAGLCYDRIGIAAPFWCAAAIAGIALGILVSRR